MQSDRKDQDALRKNRRVLETLMSNLPGMAYRCRNDRDWTMEFVSGGCLRLTGYLPEQVVGNRDVSYAELILPADREMVWQRVQEAVAERRPFQLEYRIVDVSGAVKWVWEQGVGVFADDGLLDALEGFITDINDRKTSEEALKREHRLVVTMMETSPAGILMVDGAGVITYANARAAEVLRMAVDRITGRRHDDEAFHAEAYDGSAFEPDRLPAARVFSSGTPAMNVRYAVRTADGRTVLLVANAAPVHDENGDIAAAVVTVEDVTFKVRAEQALAASEMRLRGLVEQMPFPVHVSDPDGTTVMVNRAFLDMLGLDSASRVVGKANVLKMHARVDEVIRAKIKAVFERGETLHVPEMRFPPKGFETVFGGSRANPSYQEITMFPVRLPSGEIGQVVTIWKDTTARRRADEALRESEALYRTTIDFMDEMVHLMDRDYTIVLANTAMAEMNRRLGLEADVVGKKLFDIYPFLPDRVKDEYKRVFTTMQSLWTEEENIIDNERFLTETRKIPVMKEGKPVMVLTAIRDVTMQRGIEEEKLRLEAQVQHAQKLESLGLLAGGIAHDFNNLLTGMLGNAQLAMKKLKPESPAMTNIRQIERTALLAAELTNQMLAYSGKGSFLVEPVNLSTLVAEMAHLMEVAVSKKARLEYDFAPGIPLVDADATQIRQVVMNLITNASEAIGGEPGIIAVRTGEMSPRRDSGDHVHVEGVLPEGRCVFLEVADTGQGMDAGALSRIFDPFFSTKFTGRGLGLAAVLGIVRGHSGAIVVDSRPGKGTSFKALFPCSSTAVFARQSPAAAEEPRWAGHGTVLVIDDEKVVRDVASLLFREMGFDVVVADSGETGLQAFRDRQDDISLVLLDLTMPGMDGEATLPKLLEVDPGVKVVLSSGYDEQEVTARLSRYGFAGFLKKPYEISTLRRVVRKVLGN